MNHAGDQAHMEVLPRLNYDMSLIFIKLHAYSTAYVVLSFPRKTRRVNFTSKVHSVYILCKDRYLIEAARISSLPRNSL